MRTMTLKRHTLICGMARGVDLLARKVAQEAGLTVEEHPALWDKEGRGAGYRRNERMAQVADGLLAIWDGKSKGTAHMIETMRRLNKPIRIVMV